MKAKGKIFGFLLLLVAQSVGAQVWPGDVNNNGIVNHIDLLFMAEAFGLGGPPRSPLEQGIEWEEKMVDSPWGITLSSGLDASFADSNGDGIVGFFNGPGFFDDAHAIQENYGLTHGVVTPDNFIIGEEGIDPPIFFGEASFPIFEIGIGVLPIELGTLGQPIPNFSAIAFTIEYDPDVIDGNQAIVFESDNDFGNISTVVFNSDPVAGKIEIAMSTFGPPQENFGTLANFFIVIEDNVMDMSTSEVESILKLKDVKLIGEDMVETPIYADSTTFTILNDDIINSTSSASETEIQVYPMPASNHVFIAHENVKIESIEIFDLTGRRLKGYHDIQTLNQTTIPVADLPPAPYVLKLLTEKGWHAEKILVQR